MYPRAWQHEWIQRYLAAKIAKDAQTVQPTELDIAKAYRDESTSPEEVAKKVIESIEASNVRNPSLNAFIAYQRDDIMKQAGEAAQRIKNKIPRCRPNTRLIQYEYDLL